MSTGRWKARWVVPIALLVPLALATIYLWNPRGVVSWDPRQRILGYGMYRVPSASMAPAIPQGSFIVMRAGYYRGHLPRRGDVVIFASPRQPAQSWIKRVVGLPGERIAYHDHVVSIDGRPVVYRRMPTHDAGTPGSARERELEEDLPGCPHPILVHDDMAGAGMGDGDWQVPPGQYFLLGDNRDNSEDSRYFGSVARDALRGKVIVTDDPP